MTTQEQVREQLAEILDTDGWRQVLKVVGNRVAFNRKALESYAREYPVVGDKIAARQARIDGVRDLLAHIYKTAGVEDPPQEALDIFGRWPQETDA